MSSPRSRRGQSKVAAAGECATNGARPSPREPQTTMHWVHGALAGLRTHGLSACAYWVSLPRPWPSADDTVRSHSPLRGSPGLSPGSLLRRLPWRKIEPAACPRLAEDTRGWGVGNGAVTGRNGEHGPLQPRIAATGAPKRSTTTLAPRASRSTNRSTACGGFRLPGWPTTTPPWPPSTTVAGSAWLMRTRTWEKEIVL